MSKYCRTCGALLDDSDTFCYKCGSEQRVYDDVSTSRSGNFSVKYLPGEEPEEIKQYLAALFNDLDKAYPGKNIVFSKWNHERWDKIANYLCNTLGYKNGTDFLNAYGYSIVNEQKSFTQNEQSAQTPSSRGKKSPTPVHPKPAYTSASKKRRHRSKNILFLICAVVVVVGAVLIRNAIKGRNTNDIDRPQETEYKRPVVLITLSDYVSEYNKNLHRLASTSFNTYVTDSEYISCAKTLISNSLKNPYTARYNNEKVYERDDYGRAIVYLDISAENSFGGWTRSEYYVCIQQVKKDGTFQYKSSCPFTDDKSIYNIFLLLNDFGDDPAAEELDGLLIDENYFVGAGTVSLSPSQTFECYNTEFGFGSHRVYIDSATRTITSIQFSIRDTEKMEDIKKCIYAATASFTNTATYVAEENLANVVSISNLSPTNTPVLFDNDYVYECVKGDFIVDLSISISNEPEYKAGMYFSPNKQGIEYKAPEILNNTHTQSDPVDQSTGTLAVDCSFTGTLDYIGPSDCGYYALRLDNTSFFNNRPYNDIAFPEYGDGELNDYVGKTVSVTGDLYEDYHGIPCLKNVKFDSISPASQGTVESSRADSPHSSTSQTNPSNQNARYSGTSVSITKNPVSECLAIGGKVWFIAKADGATALTWQMVDPNGAVYTLDEARQMLIGITLDDLSDGTIAVSNVPASANGWGVEASFSNGSDYAITEPAYLYVGDYLTSYGPVLDDYRTLIKYGNESNLRYDISTDLDVANSSLGYKLKDLDGDGSPELIIAAMNGTTGYWDWDNIIYSVFTLRNGIPEELFHSWARNRFYYSSLGFYSSGSSGAAFSDYYIWTLSNGSFRVIDGVCTEDNQNNPYFKVSGGDRDTGTRTYVSSQEFEDMCKYYESTIINLGLLTKIK